MFEYATDKILASEIDVFFDMIPYVSSKITKVERLDNSAKIHCQDENNEQIEEELNKLASILNSMKDSNLETVTMEDYTNNDCINEKDVFHELVENRSVRELAPGVFSYAGLFLKVYRYFNKKIDAYAYQNFENITEEIYPVLFPVSEYVKGRYFENFPHYIMFQTKLNNDIETYEKFMSKKSLCTCMDEMLEDTAAPKNVLRHATCSPVYPSLENNVLADDELRCFLVSGKCFRNEELNIKELSRLNEFYMKEFVFVGNPEKIAAFIDQSKKLIRYWIDVFALNAKCETANDSFFASNYKKLKYFQLIGNSKLEYKLMIPNNKEYISCCSANYHRTHFSKPYNIRNANGDYCYTACFAFGLERLTYAFLSQKGLDVNKWDQKTIDEISKYVDIK